MDLAFDNLERSICHKTQQTKPEYSLFLSWIRITIIIIYINELSCGTRSEVYGTQSELNLQWLAKLAC